MPVSPAIKSVFDVESFINEYYDAWSGTDLDRIMSYYTEDIVLQIPGLVMRGKEAVRDQFVRPFTTAFPGNRHLVKNMIFGPDVVTVEFNFEAKHTGPFAGHAASGARISLPGCGVYQYDSAKRQITAGRIYFDVATLLETITDLLKSDRQKAAEALQFNKNNLSLVTDLIPTLIHVLRTDGSVLYVNQAVLDYHGVTFDDVQKDDYRARFFYPEDVERLREQSRKALLRPVPFENEQRVLGKDGKYRWFLIRYNPLLDSEGNIGRWYVAAFDIEARKRVEEAQARQAGVRADVAAVFSQQTHLAEILRGCTEAIVRHLDAVFARIWLLNKNESTLELQASAGMYTRLDGSYSRISVGDLKVGWIARERKAHLTNDVMNDPRVHDKRWAELNGIVAFAGYPLIVEDRLIGVVAFFARRPLSEFVLDTLASVADIIAQGIERKRAEEDLRNALVQIQESESNLNLIINTLPALIHTGQPDGHLDYFNRRWLDYLNCSLADVEGWKWTSWIHPDDVNGIVNHWKACLASGEIFEYEARVRHSDGQYRWMFHRKVPLRDEQGNIVHWYGTSIDIEDRKQAEAQVEQAYLRLAEAQRVSKTGSFITDLLADDHNWSEELCRIFEFDPATKVTSQAIRAVFHPEDLPVYEDAFKRAGRGSDIDITYRIITPSGNVKHLHAVCHVIEKIAGRPVYIGAIQDVTESKLAEEALTRARAELAHMARVTTLSALTTSIAHEINQPIAAAINSAGACLRWLNREQPEVQRAREAALRIEDDAKRASEIISHLKSFYRKEASPQREMVSVNEVIREMLVLLRSEANSHSVVTRTELSADVPAVSADRVQLQQVLMNLMLNGMEAMTESGGELKISTGCDDGGVIVSVRDTGMGIPDENIQQIFKAFFTTKVGGTGMGLAISSAIIESHGGRIWATANRRRGATFHFSLPV